MKVFDKKANRSEPDPSSSFGPKEAGSFEQVTAVVCFILATVPIFGILAAVFASVVTWNCKDWTRMTSFIAVMLSLGVTLLYYVI